MILVLAAAGLAIIVDTDRAALWGRFPLRFKRRGA